MYKKWHNNAAKLIFLRPFDNKKSVTIHHGDTESTENHNLSRCIGRGTYKKTTEFQNAKESLTRKT